MPFSLMWTFYHTERPMSREKLNKINNRSVRIKNVSNTTHGESRKKGCDDPYGNGQGREVRQDHA